jgi:hypothetical protein
MTTTQTVLTDAPADGVIALGLTLESIDGGVKRFGMERSGGPLLLSLLACASLAARDQLPGVECVAAGGLCR